MEILIRKNASSSYTEYLLMVFSEGKKKKNLKLEVPKRRSQGRREVLCVRPSSFGKQNAEAVAVPDT